jgi:hypothetical protein
MREPLASRSSTRAAPLSRPVGRRECLHRPCPVWPPADHRLVRDAPPGRTLFKELDVRFDVGAPVRGLSMADQQLIEIARRSRWRLACSSSTSLRRRSRPTRSSA